MRVIGAGLPRTATSTQLMVLEQLGFAPCYHMRNVFADLDRQLTLWERLVAGEAGWDEILGDFDSCCDFPTSRYYRELAEHYPDAKVLLTVRSPESWARSMRETIWPMYFGDSVMRRVQQARAQVDPNWKRFLDLMVYMCWEEGTGAMVGAGTADDAELAAIMERWNEGVRRSIPPERLFEWNPADGWGGLCEFLGVPVPSEPVPHINDTSAFLEGVLGGGLAVINEWWERRDRPSGGLHGAPVDE